MKDEYEKAIDTNKINELIKNIEKLNLEIEELLRRKEQYEKETNEAYSIFKQNEREMLKVCSLLPYTRTSEEYNNILLYLDDYKDSFNELVKNKNELGFLNEQILTKETNKEENLSEIDNYSLEKDFYVNKINSINEQINKLKEIMDNPEIIEKTKKLEDARNRQNENNNNKLEVEKNLAIVKHDLENVDSLLEEKRLKKENSEEYLNYVKEYFNEELKLSFVIKENDDSLIQNAKKALSMQENTYMIKDASEMTSNLYNTYQKYNSNLTNYNATIEKCFESNKEEKDERVRNLITCIWLGKKLNLPEFIDELRHTIDIQEELIKEKDRELFEDILSQTISQKLSDRIDDSAKWVKEMSHLMKNMDTSMGLSFSLEWKAKKSEDENEMDINELEKLLTKDKVLVSEEEMSRCLNISVALFKEKNKDKK